MCSYLLPLTFDLTVQNRQRTITPLRSPFEKRKKQVPPLEYSTSIKVSILKWIEFKQPILLRVYKLNWLRVRPACWKINEMNELT